MKYRQYPKRDAIRNYFLLPNEIFTIGLMPGEISVYTFLLYLENRKTYQCWPSYETIGRAVHMSRNTVRKYVIGLESKGLITTEATTLRTDDGRIRNGNLRYTIRPIQEAIDRFHERQLSRLEIENARTRAEKRMEATS